VVVVDTGGGEGGGTCNILAQTGCAASEKCAWIVDDAAMDLGHIGCAPDTGTVADGAACTVMAPEHGGYDNCLKGHHCFGNNMTGVCKQICDQQGGAPMCGTGFACQLYEGLFGPAGMEAAGVCDPTCNPLDDNLFGKATKTGTACSMTQGCFPQFHRTGTTRSSASCAVHPDGQHVLFNSRPAPRRTAARTPVAPVPQRLRASFAL
jgi:hypothetical protein